MNKIKSWNWKKIGIIAGIVVGALLIIYFIFSMYFMSHFYFRSTVNGVASSGKSASGMVSKIEDVAKDYSISVLDDNGEPTVIESADVDMKVDVTEDKLKTLLDKQNGFAWIKYLFTDKEYVSGDIASVDHDKLVAEVSGMDCVNKEATVPTENAKVQFVGDKFEVKDEVYGDTIEVNDFANKVGAAMISFQKEFDVVSDHGYLQPTVKKDDATLNASVKKLNDVVGIKITYDVGGDKEIIPTETIATFLTTDDKGEVSYDEEKILEFVKTMAKKYNTSGQPKHLHTSYGTDVTITNGDYGWKIDNEGEKNQLIEELKAGKDVNRDFVYKKKAASRGANDYGDSYIEINLTAQHLFLYKNGSVVLESDFVSGNPYLGNATPTGAYGIMYCDKDAVLRGADYATPVNYWMPFVGNVGLHDLTSRTAFGGQIYKTNGSHGCVNLPLSAAASIFSQVSANFPVLVYNLGGTETINEQYDAGMAVKAQIAAIGDVDLSKEDYIRATRANYEALSAEARQVVKNIDVLNAAEARLDELHAEGGVAPAPEMVPQGEIPAAI